VRVVHERTWGGRYTKIKLQRWPYWHITRCYAQSLNLLEPARIDSKDTLRSINFPSLQYDLYWHFSRLSHIIVITTERKHKYNYSNITLLMLYVIHKNHKHKQTSLWWSAKPWFHPTTTAFFSQTKLTRNSPFKYMAKIRRVILHHTVKAHMKLLLPAFAMECKHWPDSSHQFVLHFAFSSSKIIQNYRNNNEMPKPQAKLN